MINKKYGFLKVIALSFSLVVFILSGITVAYCSAQEDQKMYDEHIENYQKSEPVSYTIIPIKYSWIDPIESAAKEFNVDPMLIYGIANAESGIGKYYYNEYDRDNCFNMWGLKGGNAKDRIKNENSYLRCFENEVSGARTIAKTLRLYYLDEGRISPEQICSKWIGSEFSKTHCGRWIKNVKKYYDPVITDN